MRLLKLLVVLVLCLSLAVTVFAHPGKTDSNGGHTDHSTGEYHYHHGYSAHQHYDQDGDGDLDCPYNFSDQTGPNSGSKTETHVAKLYPDETPVEEEPKITSEEKSKKKRITEDSIFNFCLIFIGFCTLMDAIKCGVDKIRQRIKK